MTCQVLKILKLVIENLHCLGTSLIFLQSFYLITFLSGCPRKFLVSNFLYSGRKQKNCKFKINQNSKTNFKCQTHFQKSFKSHKNSSKVKNFKKSFKSQKNSKNILFRIKSYVILYHFVSSSSSIKGAFTENFSSLSQTTFAIFSSTRDSFKDMTLKSDISTM